MARRRARALLAGVLAVALAVSGCTTTVSGAAVRANGGDWHDGVDLSALQAGNYPTKPRPPRPPAGDPASGAVFEAQRMAANVVGPWEVDPDLGRVVTVNILPLGKAEAIGVNLPDPMPDIAKAHGFLAGFSTARSNQGSNRPSKILINMAMRFPDPPSAAAAATEMAAKEMTILPVSPATPLPIPGHPEALGSQAMQAVGDDPAKPTVEAFTPHGMYVFYQYAQVTDGGMGAAAALVAKTLDMQGPRIDAFVPTDPAKFADLPTDPMNLLSRVLPLSKTDKFYTSMGSYPPAAALHYEPDPIASERLFDTAGVDAVGRISTVVYRAKDAPGAKLVADFMAQQFTHGHDQPAAGVPGLPDSKCIDRRENDVAMKAMQEQFTCIASADQYAYETDSEQLEDAHQRMAAQYLILVAK
jgi:hypothetical protein